MLTGPTIQVTAAVWAELMRTRTNTNPTEAGVARIQQQSGCRIHIERRDQEIRLFGPEDSVAAAQYLVEELHCMCVEQGVKMDCPSYLDIDMLQTFAQEFGVTLQIEEQQITVLGIEGAVMQAAQELQNYDSNRQCFSVVADSKPSAIARSAIMAAMADLKVDRDITSASDSGAENSGIMDFTMQGAVMSCKPSSQNQHQQSFNNRDMQQNSQSSGPCPTCGCSAKFCVHCGNPTQKAEPGAGCPTCGVSKFCVYCGQPSEQRNTANSANMKNIQTMPMQHAGPSLNMFKQEMPYNNQMQVMSMPMQFPQGGAYNSPAIMQAPDGTMMMCFPMDTQNGLMPASNMIAPKQWNTGMMPMPYTSFE